MRTAIAVTAALAVLSCSQGPKGDPGPAGMSGGAGDRGSQGDRGEAGDRGPKGDRGDTGDQGPAGPSGDAGPQGPAGPSGDAGPPGSQGDAGAAGSGGVIFKDATGKQLPVAWLFGHYVFFDAIGSVWNFDIASASIQDPTNTITNVAYESNDCSGDVWVYPSAAPRVVWGSFLDGPTRVLKDNAAGKVIQACSFKYANAPNVCAVPVGCSSGFAYPFADSVKVTPPDVSMYTAPIHPELAP